MANWTVQDYLDKVKNECDMNDEDFITADEWLGYINQAINAAEQKILGINEDYFLDSTTLSTTSGSQTVTLPSQIYAHKIRKIFYVNGTEKYEVRRIRELSETPWIDDNDCYKYMINNSLSAGPVIKLYPAARETASNFTCWYLRNAREVTSTTDVVDIPEAQNYISAYLRVCAWTKESHPNLDVGLQDLAKQEAELVSTLTTMVPDEDNKILMDLGYFDEVDVDGYL